MHEGSKEEREKRSNFLFITHPIRKKNRENRRKIDSPYCNDLSPIKSLKEFKKNCPRDAVPRTKGRKKVY